MMTSESSQIEPTIVKLQSDQFIIRPLAESKVVQQNANSIEVDLVRQNCQCDDFESHRKSFPIGDPRRFCTHMIRARSENMADLHPFLQSLLEARDATDSGIPDGNTFAFFELDGLPGFYGENRDQTDYFLLADSSRSVLREYVYDRLQKTWIDENKPEAADRLLVFSFRERSKFDSLEAEQDAKTSKAKRKRRRRSTGKQREIPSLLKYAFLFVVTVALVAGGYFLFRDDTAAWFAELAGLDTQTVSQEDSGLPSKKEMIQTHKENTAEEVAKKLREQEEQQAANQQAANQVKADANKPQNSKVPSEETVEVPSSPAEPTDQPLDFRTWKTADDAYSVSARYKSFMNGTVTLQRQDNGLDIKIDQSELSPDDQVYIKEVRRERRLKLARERRNKSAAKDSQ